MGAVAIVAIEGVLTDLEAQLPQATVNLHAAKLVRALGTEWPLIYLSTTADVNTAVAWVRAAPVPTGVYVLAPSPLLVAEAILEAMGARLDRPALYLAGTPRGFDTLTAKGVSTLLYRHESFVLGDWQQESSWRNPDDDDTDPLQRS